MAKIKFRPFAGALSALLKMKNMTQMDASKETRVDRKTLARIDAGEEVKLETLQRVATKLQVRDDYFRDPQTAEAHDNVPPALEPGNIMLRKLDSVRLEALLKGAARIRWELNAQVRDDAARQALEQFEEDVEKSRQQLSVTGDEDRLGLAWNSLYPPDSLRFQLGRVRTAEDIAARLESLNTKHRLAVLGADYLFWECSSEDGQYEDRKWTTVNYISCRTVLFSIEPSGTQSRRVRVSQGSLPPQFAPKQFAPKRSTAVFVNGLPLPVRPWEELDE